MAILRYMRHLIASFFIGILVFFAPSVALVLFVVIVTPFFLSLTMGLWAAFNGLLWLGMHDQYLRQPTFFWGSVSIVSFAIGWILLTILHDAWYWLAHRRDLANASLEMALKNDGRYLR